MTNQKLHLCLSLVLLAFAGIGCTGTKFTDAGSAEVASLSKTGEAEDTSESDDTQVSEASEEVVQACPADIEEPTADYAAIRESLISRLTTILARLKEQNTSSYTSGRLEKHDELVSKTEADLEELLASEELPDRFKNEIDDRHFGMHRPPFGFGESGFGEQGPGKPEFNRQNGQKDLHDKFPGKDDSQMPKFDEACVEKMKQKFQLKMCDHWQKLIDSEDLDTRLKSRLEENFESKCGASEIDNQGSEEAETSDETGASETE